MYLYNDPLGVQMKEFKGCQSPRWQQPLQSHHKCVIAWGIFCRTSADFRSGFPSENSNVFASHRWALPSHWAGLLFPVQWKDRRIVECSQLLWPSSYFLSCCYLFCSTAEEHADLHLSGLGKCTLSTHVHATGPDPVWHLLLQQRL